MDHVFQRNSRSVYPVAVSGEGPYLIDAEGRLRATFYGAGADAISEAARTVLRETS